MDESVNQNGEMIAPTAFAGAMPMPTRKDITILPADNPQKPRIGWTIKELSGVVAINDYALNKITIDGDDDLAVVEVLNEYMKQYARG